MIITPIKEELEKEGYTEYINEDHENGYLISFSATDTTETLVVSLYMDVSNTAQEKFDILQSLTKICEEVKLKRVDNRYYTGYTIEMRDIEIEKNNIEIYDITISYNKIKNQITRGV